MSTVEDEDHADAVYRASNVNARQRALIMQLAETGDHKLTLEGEKAFNKTWQWLEDNGWIRRNWNGFTGSDCVNVVMFTLPGWEALCILVDEEEAAETA